MQAKHQQKKLQLPRQQTTWPSPRNILVSFVVDTYMSLPPQTMLAHGNWDGLTSVAVSQLCLPNKFKTCLSRKKKLYCHNFNSLCVCATEDNSITTHLCRLCCSALSDSRGDRWTDDYREGDGTEGGWWLCNHMVRFRKTPTDHSKPNPVTNVLF